MSQDQTIFRYDLLKRREDTEPRYGVFDNLLQLIVATGTLDEMSEYIRARLNE